MELPKNEAVATSASRASTGNDLMAALYTPKEAAVAITRAMTGKEAEQHISALNLRERVIDHLAIFAWHEAGRNPRTSAQARKPGLHASRR